MGEKLYHESKENNIVSYKVNIGEFNLTFITPLEPSVSTLSELDLSTIDIYNDYQTLEGYYTLYFPHFNFDSLNNVTNIDNVLNSHNLLFKPSLDKKIKSNETLELKDMKQFNKFEVNEDGFEGYSISIGIQGPTSSGPTGKKIILSHPFYFIVSLPNDLPIFSIKVADI